MDTPFTEIIEDTMTRENRSGEQSILPNFAGLRF
jgi:hypothetical protein